MGFRKILGRFGGDQRGAIAIWAAVSMPMIVGIGALAFDMNAMYTTKAQLQHTADAAAMAAAQALPDQSAAVTAAQNYGQLNMASAEHGTVVSSADVQPGNWDTSSKVFTPAGTPINAVRVAARRSSQNDNAMSTFIARALGIDSVDVSASAIVATNGMGAGNACLISLNTTASQAFYLQGNGSVKTTGCDIFVNSCHSVDALMGQGNTYIELDAELEGADTGKIYVCGEVTEQGPAYFYPNPVYPYKNNEENYASDPFYYIEFPEVSSDPMDCDHTNFSSSASTVDLTPGLYCGGINLTGGGAATFAAGNYVIKDGPFSVAGSKIILAEGVTVFLTGSAANLDFGGTADIHLSAPTSGVHAGFIFFGDKENVASSPHLMRGTPMGGYDGAIYLPGQKVLMQGTAGVMSGYTSDCTMVVADTFSFLGTPNFEAQRSGCTYAGGGGGQISVRVVGQ